MVVIAARRNCVGWGVGDTERLPHMQVQFACERLRQRSPTTQTQSLIGERQAPGNDLIWRNQVCSGTWRCEHKRASVAYIQETTAIYAHTCNSRNMLECSLHTILKRRSADRVRFTTGRDPDVV